MRALSRIALISVCTMLLQACALTSHDRGVSAPGSASSSEIMEKLIDLPGPIELETIASVDWESPLGGLLNLDSAAARQAGLKDHVEPIQVFVYVLRHPQRGVFLVDTGVARAVIDDPNSVGVDWIARKGLWLDRMHMLRSTDDVVRAAGGKLDGVLFTHLHFDHISGLPDIPNDVPLYVGKGEATEVHVLNAVTRASDDALLQGKGPLHEWTFQPDPQHRFDGIVDVFDDESVFAISVPGHTLGSTAYLVRTTRGPVLLTGDTCHTRWGWEHAVEPGMFTDDQSRNRESLLRLKQLVADHPSITVRLGHQP